MIFRGRLSAVFSVTVLYCFVIGIVHAHLMPSTTSRLNDPLKEHFFAVAAGNLWCHTLPSGFNFSGSYQLISHNKYKSIVPVLPPAEEITGFFNGEQFRQYVVHAGGFAVRCRKSNLIFPFHYFW